jgi:uncharacterized damage-inducible protein DinB
MSGEARRLEEQLRRALEGGAWHGPALLEVVASVSAAQASAHPIPGAHSIWELVLHVASSYPLVLRRLGGDGRPLTPAEDWPPCPEPTEENWRRAVQQVVQLDRELRQRVLAFPEDRLDQPLVPEPPYTAYMQFIGITQHNLYHAGQIALLKRALGVK